MSESQWLEMELTRQLAPVDAPDELWPRIAEPQIQQRPARTFEWGWALAAAAALVLTVTGGLVWRIAQGRGLDSLAIEELHSAGALDFRSEDPSEIRAWVKAKSGIDIELPDRLPAGSGVRLMGARMIARSGSPAAAVAYRVKDRTAALLVAQTHGSAGSAHRFARSGAGGVFSWTMRGEEYAIASSAGNDPRIACLLCHAQVSAAGI